MSRIIRRFENGREGEALGAPVPASSYNAEWKKELVRSLPSWLFALRAAGKRDGSKVLMPSANGMEYALVEGVNSDPLWCGTRMVVSLVSK